ncbi:MAG: hypothetical protein ACR2ME_01010, partial [Acidimicrobiia bacterium]
MTADERRRRGGPVVTLVYSAPLLSALAVLPRLPPGGEFPPLGVVPSAPDLLALHPPLSNKE